MTKIDHDSPIYAAPSAPETAGQAAQGTEQAQVTPRPWWRLWTQPRAIRSTVRPGEFGFEQDFDDGGSHD